jgi:hypothetical protein
LRQTLAIRRHYASANEGGDERSLPRERLARGDSLEEDPEAVERQPDRDEVREHRHADDAPAVKAQVELGHGARC